MKDTSRGGIGVVWGLTFIFIVLKLIGYIDWAWVWVLSPVWISFCFGLLLVLIGFLLYILIGRKVS